MNFYITISIIALIILIILLTLYGIYYKKLVSKPFPEIQEQCPKMWDLDFSGNCVPPTNNINTLALSSSNTPSTSLVYDGNNNIISFNPTDAGWSTYNGETNDICGKKKWSNSNKIEWNGVSNYNSC
jgi:hypothetical protein